MVLPLAGYRSPVLTATGVSLLAVLGVGGILDILSAAIEVVLGSSRYQLLLDSGESVCGSPVVV